MGNLKRYYFNHFIQNKYNHLLFILILFFFFGPLPDFFNTKFSILSLVFVLSLILTLRAVGAKKRTFWILSAMGASGYILHLLQAYEVGFLGPDYFGVAIEALFLIFMMLSIVLLARKMISSTHVDGDTIKGGICIYILIGYAWTIIYSIIYFFDSYAFTFSNSALRDQGFGYFSFVTLTTLGFGDITPVNSFAKNFTSLEAVTGQMFLALFISRLIGLYLIQDQNK